MTMRTAGSLFLLFAIGNSNGQVTQQGDCLSSCDPDRSCKVSWTGSFRPGGTQASCFSPDFGGSCFGTVPGCKDCNQVCTGGGSSSGGGSSRPSSGSGGSSSQSCAESRRCGRGQECKPVRLCGCAGAAGVFEFGDDTGRSCPGECSVAQDFRCKSSRGGSSSSSGGSSGSGGSKTGRNCSYKCQSNGGCEVTYIGPSRPGQTSGSCFPQSFGGSCSGTPPECQDCNRALNCSSGGGSSSSGGNRPSNSGNRPSGEGSSSG